MFFTIYGDPMYLIEGTPNQTHQVNIYSIHEPSYTELFFVNSTISPLHTNTHPQTPVATIVLCPHCHTLTANNVYPASPVDQCLKQNFQPAFTGCKIIVDKTTSDTPFLEQNGYNLSKLPPLLHNLNLKYDTLKKN